VTFQQQPRRPDCGNIGHCGTSCHSAGNGQFLSVHFSTGQLLRPKAIRNISVVFETVCAELGLRDKDDRAMRLVASKIIEFAQSGVVDAAKLRSMTRKKFKLE